MIQTQLLKADKPYQIISAGGMVGVQVATLIVTEDKLSPDGSYLIDTHSHPVVNYANKEGLTEDLKYWDGDPETEYIYTSRLQPEGAVWNKVEVRDIRVLGLVGAKNPAVDFATFTRLVPSVLSSDPNVSPVDSLWGEDTCIKIRNLIFSFSRVGIKCEGSTQDLHVNYTNTTRIDLELELEGRQEPLVLVSIRESDYNTWPIVEGIYFRCVLGDNSANTIVKCMRELDDQFIKSHGKLEFTYHRYYDKWKEQLESLVDNCNNLWKSRYDL